MRRPRSTLLLATVLLTAVASLPVVGGPPPRSARVRTGASRHAPDERSPAEIEALRARLADVEAAIDDIEGR